MQRAAAQNEILKARLATNEGSFAARSIAQRMLARNNAVLRGEPWKEVQAPKAEPIGEAEAVKTPPAPEGYHPLQTDNDKLLMTQPPTNGPGNGRQVLGAPQQAMAPAEKLELEAAAGRPLSDEDAAKFRNNQLIAASNASMVKTGAGLGDEVSKIGEPYRAERKAAAKPTEVSKLENELGPDLVAKASRISNRLVEQDPSYKADKGYLGILRGLKTDQAEVVKAATTPYDDLSKAVYRITKSEPGSDRDVGYKKALATTLSKHVSTLSGEDKTAWLRSSTRTFNRLRR